MGSGASACGRARSSSSHRWGDTAAASLSPAMSTSRRNMSAAAAANHRGEGASHDTSGAAEHTEVETSSLAGTSPSRAAHRSLQSGWYGNSNAVSQSQPVSRFGNGRGPTIDVDASFDQSRFGYAPSSRSMPSSAVGSNLSEPNFNTPDSHTRPSLLFSPSQGGGGPHRSSSPARTSPLSAILTQSSPLPGSHEEFSTNQRENMSASSTPPDG